VTAAATAPAALPTPASTPIRRTPTILQLEAVECGAAALAMVLAYYKCHVPLEQLRVECGVSRDGSKASNLLRAGRIHGLAAKGYRKEPADLALLTLPAIVFWNFNHFVVLEGFRGGKAYLNDPAQGRRCVDSDEFDRSFTGVVLAFEPGPDFKPGGSRPSVVKSLRQYFSGMKQAVALLVALGLALVAPGVLLPLLSSRFVDDVLVAHLDGMVMPLLAGIAATALLRAVLAWTQTRYLSRTHARSALHAASRFFWHALRLPAEFFTQRSAGEIASRMSLNERVAETLSGDLSQVLLSLITASFFLLLMFRYDVQLTLIAIGAVALELFIWRAISERTAELSQQMSVHAGRLAGASINGLSNIETIKASGQEWGLFSKWIGLQTQYVNTAVRVQGIGLTLGQVPGVLGLLVNLAILGLASVRIIHGQMTIGELVAYQTLFASFAAPTHTLLSLSQKIQTLRGDLARLDDVLRYPAEILDVAETSAGAPLQKLRGELELRDISFGYNRNAAPVIANLSLRILPGQRVALVGASGSGKSTVSRLIVGLYRPWEGEVLFDGRPRAAHERVVFAASMAIVDQDVFLFEGSVRDNLTMWDKTIADEDIVAACKDACIHDVIVSRSGGYEALIDEGGRNLSGGQRQRLEIARALVRNPRILILDEATSALDAATERSVEENLRRRGCTCLVVAHRLSTVRDADQIHVIDAGRVAECGTHNELMRIDGGIYARLAATGMQ
jgi:NHLM bacteriocin system ABC transporter peptidase/ATP-binding protein